MVIVEQDAAPTINPNMLPAGCQYFLLQVDGPFDSALCFDTGMGISNPSHTFIIFSDSDIVVEEWDICGSLECASGMMAPGRIHKYHRTHSRRHFETNR